MNIMTHNAPSDWKIEKLGQLFKERKEKVSDKDYLPLSVSKQGIVPQMESVAKSDDSDNRKRVAIGDFVINSRSDRKGSSGISEYDGSVSLISIVLEPRHGHPRFLHHLLRSQAFQEEFYRFGHGIVADLWTTRFSEMKSILLALPAYKIQKEIADFLDRETSRIDQLINKKMRLIGVLEEKKAILINKTVREGIYPQEMNEPNLPWLKKIPKHWKIERLRHIGELQNGISEGAEYFGSGHPFVGYGDVYKNFSLPKELSGLAKSSSSDQARYSVKRGDIFFTRTSEVAEEIGFSSVCLDTIEKATFSGFLIRFRPIRDALFPEYSQYYFRSDIPRFFFIKEMNLVTRVSLGQNLLKNLPILIPPLDEQKTLALYLEDHTNKIDQIITKENMSIEKLKEMKSSLITQAVTGQLDIHAWKRRGTGDHQLDQIERDTEQEHKSKKARA